MQETFSGNGIASYLIGKNKICNEQYKAIAVGEKRSRSNSRRKLKRLNQYENASKDTS